MKKTVVGITGAGNKMVGYARNPSGKVWIVSAVTAEVVLESLRWFYAPETTTIVVQKSVNADAFIHKPNNLGYHVEAVERPERPADRRAAEIARVDGRPVGALGAAAFHVARCWIDSDRNSNSRVVDGGC